VFWRLICALFLVAVSAAQNVPPALRPAGFRIAGTVVHSLTGQPLPQIQLSIIRPQTPDVLQTVNANDRGYFAFQVSAPGKYVLEAQGRGFPRQSWDEHNGFSTAVVVGPGKDSEHVIFRARPEASISGVVTDEADEPVRDAQVMLFHRASEEENNPIHLREQVSTDDQGHYRFAHLFPGTFFVVVSARPWYAQTSNASGNREMNPLDVAYPVTYFSGTTDANRATAIVLSPGERISADLSVAPSPALRLEITGLGDQGGDTSLSAMQKIFGEVPVPANIQTEGHVNGRLFITGLPPGNVEINGTSPGNPGRSWKQSVNLSASGSLKIAAQGPPISITGNVVLGDAKFRGSWISLTNRATGDRSQEQIKPDGKFQFSDMPLRPGTYQIAVHNVPGAILANVVATGAKVEGRDLEIGEGATVTISLLMSKGFGTIDGTALQDGKPMPGAMILLVPHDLANNQSRIRRDQSDSDGTFTLPQIAPGRYTLLALRNGWDLEWQNPAVLKPYLGHAEVVLVGPNQRYLAKVNVQ
jgi:hypothetical protein